MRWTTHSRSTEPDQARTRTAKRRSAAAVIASVLCAALPTYAAITVTGDVEPAYNGVDDPWDAGQELSVGATMFGSGSMRIDGGSSVTDVYGYVGEKVVSWGEVTVTGSGSAWSNTHTLIVGMDDHGILNIENSGLVTSRFGNIGYFPGGTGTVTVTGPGSAWTSENINVGTFGGFGTLIVKAGGAVVSGGLSISDGNGSKGVATITGVGSGMTLGGLSVGSGGNGRLNIDNGGHVEVAGDTRLNSRDVTDGLIHLNNGTLTTGGLVASPQELTGTGTINTATMLSDVDLVFDAVNGLQQQFTFNSLPGQDVTVNVDASGPAHTGTLGAGYRGAGTLTIADGLSVGSSMGYIGYQAGSSGAATVRGAGSTWNNTWGLTVGLRGNGTLAIEAGGLVTADSVSIAQDANNVTASVSVDGSGSRLISTGKLNVATGGHGELSITNGGVVQSHGATLGFDSGSSAAVRVSGAGSAWINSGGLIIGKEYSGYGDEGIGTGTLVIESGGRVSSAVAYLAMQPEAVGAVTVRGSGSVWQNTGWVYLGGGYLAAGGTGELMLEDGGRVVVGETLKVWGTGTVRGSGEIVAAELVNGGVVKPGHDTAGVLAVDGDYTQEPGGTLEIGRRATGTTPGVSFDWLAVSGSAVLDGALRFQWDPGFPADGGTKLVFLTADDGITGAFSSVDVPERTNVIYGLNDVALSLELYSGDLDSDHHVGIDDLNTVLSHWNQSVPAGSWAHGDSSGDGFVGIEDLNPVLGNWNAGTPPQSANIPEPGTLTLFALSTSLLRRKQHPAVAAL